MARIALVALVAASLCGCEGELVNLGRSPLPVGGASASGGQGTAGTDVPGGVGPAWQPPVLLVPQQELLQLSNPTLTSNEELLYYTEQQQPGDPPVGIVRRSRQGDAWVEPTSLDFGLEMLDVSSPAISLDGQQLWFGRNVAEGVGETDIWRSRLEGGAWGEPEHAETPLNSPADDAPRPFSADGTLMPLSSNRQGGPDYHIWLARRALGEESWGAPDRNQLENVDVEGFTSVDGFLSEGGLALYFASDYGSMGGLDLFVARRSTVLESFGPPEPLTGINTAADERSPWVSSNGERLYFASKRDSAEYAGDFAQWALYRSQRLP